MLSRELEQRTIAWTQLQPEVKCRVLQSLHNAVAAETNVFDVDDDDIDDCEEVVVSYCSLFATLVAPVLFLLQIKQTPLLMVM